jgi:hypothetical protein
MATTTRVLSGPAGTSVSSPRMPRSFDSLSTVTSTDRSSIPTEAARIATSVATHDASAARSSQPGDGAALPPPTLVGMSVRTFAPSGPTTVVASPSDSRARATVSR